MHDSIVVPACFSSLDHQTQTNNIDSSSTLLTRSGQSVFVSVYRAKLAGQCRLITITWCKNLLLHGLSVSVGDERDKQLKIALKPWYFWRKQGSKQFEIDGRTVDVVWDLKTAKFNGETEPRSDYFVAITCEDEVVLLLGDQKKDAYRKTGCRPSLIDPILVSRKEHVFGKKKFSTRIKFHEKGSFHCILIESNNHVSDGFEFDQEMEIKVDGESVVHVKHLQWKFRGNESIDVSKTKVQVYWDVHDWLFGSAGSRHGLFIFKPVSLSDSSTFLPWEPAPSYRLSDPEMDYALGDVSGDGDGDGDGEDEDDLSSRFCLFLYAWKME